MRPPLASLGISFPLLAVRLSVGDNFTEDIHALVDSGASYTLARWELADDLEIDPMAGRKVSIGPLGPRQLSAYEARVTLSARKNGHDVVTLSDSYVYFTKDMPSWVDVLLGQHDALERMIFVQQNFLPEPRFRLSVAP
jgi:hypothetical protein